MKVKKKQKDNEKHNEKKRKKKGGPQRQVEKKKKKQYKQNVKMIKKKWSSILKVASIRTGRLYYHFYISLV